MKWLLAAVIAALLPAAAWAQNASTCTAYSRRAITHPAGETSYTLSPTDQCALLVFLNTSSETVTMPVPGALFPKGWTVKMLAFGSGGLSISPATGTQYNNSASPTAIAQNVGADVYIGNGVWWGKP